MMLQREFYCNLCGFYCILDIISSNSTVLILMLIDLPNNIFKYEIDFKASSLTLVICSNVCFKTTNFASTFFVVVV